MFLVQGNCGRHWSLLLLAALAGLLVPARSAIAQSKARVDVAPAGAASYLPGHWGTVQLTFVNLEDKPENLFAATYFDQDRSLQFGRKTWVPAQSRLTVAHSIHIPPLERGARTFDFHTLLLDPKQENETLVRGGLRDLKMPGRLRLGQEPATAIIYFPEEHQRNDNGARDLPYELAVAAKSSQMMGRSMAQLLDPILPATPEAYGCIDQLIVADNRLAQDGPAITAVRRWLFGGGHLWVMLDRVDPQLLELLLGDEFSCEVVGRAELTTVKITPTHRTPGGEISVREYDQAVGMVLVHASGVDVSCTVEGWPAAFWKQCGEGRLLVTTLAPDGWMEKRLTAEAGPISRPTGPPAGEQSKRPAAQAPKRPPAANPQEAAMMSEAESRMYFAVPPLKEIAAEFFSPRNPQAFDTKVLEPHTREYVGRSVPSRWFVTTMLGGFGAALAGLGVVLWRNSRLEWLGAVGPLLAVGVSSVLMLTGLMQRRSIPPTVATVQYIEPLAGTNDILVVGQTDIYAPDSANTIIASQKGGWITPDRHGQGGQTARMVWTDMESWEWQHLPPNYNQRMGEFSTTAATAERMEAKATFDKDGLTGQFNAKAVTHPADAVLAASAGRIGVDLKADGSFQALASQVFSGEQFIAAELLTDEQNRRSRTMSGIFEGTKRPDFPIEPKLLVWADPLDIGFQFDQGHRQLGAALIAIPLILERPAVGTEVAIPSPFLSYRQVNGPDGIVAAGLYDHRSREWQARSLTSSAWLRFQIPQVLVPLELRRAKVTVQVDGPIGKLEIAGLRGKEPVPVKTWVDPVGTVSVEFEEPELLQVTDGGLMLKVSGGDAARPGLTQLVGKANYWRIESLHLELHGKTSSLPANQP